MIYQIVNHTPATLLRAIAAAEPRVTTVTAKMPDGRTLHFNPHEALDLAGLITAFHYGAVIDIPSPQVTIERKPKMPDAPVFWIRSPGSDNHKLVGCVEGDMMWFQHGMTNITGALRLPLEAAAKGGWQWSPDRKTWFNF